MARQVLATHPTARFLIVGHGPGWERVNGYLDQMNLRPAVLMTGHREDIERILPLCTVCVLPSDKNEGVPQAVLQQLACERAVVGTAAGDIPEVVREGQTGLLVPAGQAEPLAEAVVRLLDDEDLRRDLGRGGRQFVIDNYSRQIMLSRTEEVYALALAPNKALAGRPPGGAR
jgi:glycosyltransferase involved in cell wall biosynthesis